jgi:hypothetical protein
MSATSIVTTPPIGEDDADIFHFRKLSPDMRLTIFGTELHIHSTVLRANSTFFEQYFGDADQNPAVRPTTSEFRFNMIACVDKDGNWA